MTDARANDRTRSGGAAIAQARVGLCYRWRHGRWPRIDRPELFTEWVQHRKLVDRDARYPPLSDKLAVKALVADRLGAAWVTPTLWAGTALPRAADWPAPFVVKARHGCRYNAFVDDPVGQWPAVRRAAERWVRRRYGYWLDEWAYAHVPRGLLVEPFIGDASGRLPIDYKFYVFAGRVTHVQVHRDRASNHRWLLLDRDWRVAQGCAARWRPDPPATLARMIEAAEALGASFDFVRVDFYEVAGAPRFGEMTFYPGSGLDPFDPPLLDRSLGRLWADSRQAAGAGSIR